MAKGTYHKRPVGAGVTLTPAGASVNSVLSTLYPFIHVYSTADVHLVFGTVAPTAVADETCLYIKGTTPYIFPINPGEYVAVIGTATVELHYMK